MEGLMDRITVEPGKCGGKPCIRGMRITVRRVLELLATFPNQDVLLSEYPFLEPEDLQQALRYAAVFRDDYNYNRPHSSLGYLTPAAFA